MKNLSVVLIALACVFTVLAEKKEVTDKVKIAVYYEALCPDSEIFITDQLAPVWKELRGALKVKLVPYGKATHSKVNGVWRFTCQHGEPECRANKMQACILKDPQFTDETKIDIILCLMSRGTPGKDLNRCMKEVNQDAALPRVEECSTSSRGDDLLAAAGEKTKRVKERLTFVPTVVFNEVFDQKNQDQAMMDLQSVVCKLATEKPPTCPT